MKKPVHPSSMRKLTKRQQYVADLEFNLNHTREQNDVNRRELARYVKKYNLSIKALRLRADRDFGDLISLVTELLEQL